MKAVIAVLVLIVMVSYFVSGEFLTAGKIYAWALDYNNNKWIELDTFKGVDFGESWFWNFLEAPVNVISWLGYYIIYFIVEILNFVSALFTLIGIV